MNRRTAVEVGGGEFRFGAAHAGLHGGQFEPLHGHTFVASLRLYGLRDPRIGILVDFAAAKDALRVAISPVRVSRSGWRSGVQRRWTCRWTARGICGGCAPARRRHRRN